MNKYSEETIKTISELLAKGFNSSEIAVIVSKHPVTVRNIKTILKRRNMELMKNE